MCQRVTCKQCHKVTWVGCGQHVEQVMAGIPPDARCPGHAGDPSAPSGLARLFGRRARHG
ncbi:MAG: hypothetical protein ACOYBY_02835 [Dermatophilaceae bacterium]